MKRPEQALQILVADYLRLQYPHLLWFHPSNNIPIPNKARLGGIMKRMGVRSGVADILLFWGNEKAAIELKAGKNTMQDTQMAFKRDWEAIGGYYRICRSLDDVIAHLKLWGVK